MVANYDAQRDDELMYFLKGVYKSPNIKAYFNNIKEAEKERQTIYSMGNISNKNSLIQNINEFTTTQQKIIGVFTRSKFKKHAFDLRSTFQSMSYIRLEVLGRKKEALYEGKDYVGKRGDVKYLKRNEKQYFWDFIGEFWADELGDYVFTLPPECPQNG